MRKVITLGPCSTIKECQSRFIKLEDDLKKENPSSVTTRINVKGKYPNNSYLMYIYVDSDSSKISSK